MTIDRYTKTVLTVIAVCLVWLCVILTPVGTAVHAQPGVQDVRIVAVKHPGLRSGVVLAVRASPLAADPG